MIIKNHPIAKEIFYTNENIEEKAYGFLKELLPIRDRYGQKFQIEDAALLIVDMQPFFLDQSSHAIVPSAIATIPVIQKIEQYFIKHRRPIFLSVHVFTDESNNMKKWWGSRSRYNDFATKAVDELIMEDNLYVINKTQYDVFYKTNFADLLKEHKIKQLVITGLMTHICCDTTARSAFMRGLDVFMLVDGVSSYNEILHLGALRNLAHSCVTPMVSEEMF